MASILLRLVYLVLAPMWLYLIPLTHEMIEWQGSMIGGTQFFEHVGISTFIDGLRTLEVLATLMSILLVAGAASSKFPRKILFFVALALLVMVIVLYMPIFTNGIAVLRSLVFPFHLKHELFAILGLSVVTLIFVSRQVTHAASVDTRAA